MCVMQATKHGPLGKREIEREKERKLVNCSWGGVKERKGNNEERQCAKIRRLGREIGRE